MVFAEREPPPPLYGTLTTTWTLGGSTSPAACTHNDIDRVDVVVFDDYGLLAAAGQPICETFADSFVLPAGFYSTEMTLLDFGGHAVSDTVIADEYVAPGREVFVDADFYPDGLIF